MSTASCLIAKPQSHVSHIIEQSCCPCWALRCQRQGPSICLPLNHITLKNEDEVRKHRVLRIVDHIWKLSIWVLMFLSAFAFEVCRRPNKSNILYSLFPTEMLESNNLLTFNGLSNSSAYHKFLLDEERGRLFVGAKDHVLSFNLVDINLDLQLVRRGC